jgi:hypothetical protein
VASKVFGGLPPLTEGAELYEWTLVVNPEGEKVLPPERVKVTVILLALVTV